MDQRQRIGGIAALIEAATFIFGIILLRSSRGASLHTEEI